MINFMAAGLILFSLFAVGMAYFFGKRYHADGNKSYKYLCVCCCVSSCVCIVTAIQLLFMFHSV